MANASATLSHGGAMGDVAHFIDVAFTGLPA